MICEKCKMDIPDDEMYCQHCGALRPAPPFGKKCCTKCKKYIPKDAKICPICQSKQGGPLSCSGMLGALVFLIALPFIISAIANVMAGYRKSANSSATTTTAVTAPITTTPISVLETSTASPTAAEDVNQEILSKLEQIAKENLGENYEVKYWDSMNAYSISCWVDGLASAVASGVYTAEWQSMVIAAATTSSIGAKEIREIDPSANLCFIICNEMNIDNMFVLTMNGEVLYDVLDPNLEHYK